MRQQCEHILSTGRCEMDDGHRGRHTTVAFTCDGCDKRRRGSPVAHASNPWDGVHEASFCFMCIRVPMKDRRADWRMT